MTEHSLLATFTTKWGVDTGNHSRVEMCPEIRFAKMHFMMSLTACEAILLFSLRIINVCAAKSVKFSLVINPRGQLPCVSYLLYLFLPLFLPPYSTGA